MAAGGFTAQQGMQGIKRLLAVRGTTTHCVNQKLRCVAAAKSQSSLVKSVRLRNSFSVCVHGTSTTQFNSGAGLQICVSTRTPAVIKGRRLNILQNQKKQGDDMSLLNPCTYKIQCFNHILVTRLQRNWRIVINESGC